MVNTDKISHLLQDAMKEILLIKVKNSQEDRAISQLLETLEKAQNHDLSQINEVFRRNNHGM